MKLAHKVSAFHSQIQSALCNQHSTPQVEWHAVEVESGKACLWIILAYFGMKDKKKCLRQKTCIYNALR